MELTDTDKAYIAGIIDGEGSISIVTSRRSSKEYYELHLQISNTDSNLMKWLQERVGGNVKEWKASRRLGKKVGYTWTTNANKAAAILEDTLPYLVVKRIRAEDAIFFQSLRAHRSKSSTADRFVDRIIRDAVSPRKEGKD